MTPHDFIYDQIYKGRKRQGIPERIALNSATDGLDQFKKGKFKKAAEIIDTQIKKAKKLNK